MTKLCLKAAKMIINYIKSIKKHKNCWTEEQQTEPVE